MQLGVTAQLRFEAVSFFTVVFLVLAGAVMLVWNGLRNDFPALPRLTYGRSLGLLLLWGLAMSLVLSMITGARELMTPGVWERAGALYQVTGDRPQSEAEQLFQMREANLQRLGRALLRYAEHHEGHFPAHELVGDVPEELWHSLAITGERYVYFTGREQPRVPRGRATPLAYEPEIYGDVRLVLFTDGAVKRMARSELGERYQREMKTKFPELYRETE